MYRELALFAQVYGKCPMSESTRPVGMLFGHVYLERGAASRESETFRRRLGAYVQHTLDDHHWKIATYINIETGLKVPTWAGAASAGCKYQEFFDGVDIVSALNAVTLIWKWLTRHLPSRDPADAWLGFVTRVLREENMAYELDEKCGVHYAVDEEFTRTHARYGGRRRMYP